MNRQEDNDTKTFPRPSEAMRAMRPHLFSDAQPDSAPRLTKALLEYQLETLTSRKQEYEFEHFCRKLAEKEICPNLRTQTGPTGGGDSKVDTETYPVASEVAERWWIGEPSSGTDRWAFAFSSKKKWKEKCATDVAKVVATGRGYKHIYFFTNQFVSDRVRASLEDQLTKKYEVPVHVIDRTWIVEKVLANGHALLAISALAIEGVSSGASRAGPLDTARLAELEELDNQISDPSRYANARFQLVEDCLQAALLARGLERPRAEVEGRFDRAARLAQGSGKQQRMRIAYYQAWTAYWWYDDFGEFGKFYDQVETTVDGTTLAADTQRLANLWQLLLPAVASNRLNSNEAKVDSRRVKLEAILRTMADDEVRPNNAIQARSQLTMIEVTSALHASDKGRLEDCWTKLGEIADEARHLPAYPIEPLSDMLRMLGKVIDSAGFDKLYEKIVEIVRNRRSEGEAGEAYKLRGIQKLEQEKPYEAIQWFGRAEELLLKEEYAEELVLVLAGSSIAYERVGLLWAARQKILAAAERCSQAFFEDGRIGLAMARSFNRLVWLELQLGRIPHALSAMGLASAIAKHLKLSDEERQAYSKEVEQQESALMIHALRMSKEQLRAVPELADIFERIGLTNARLALLFALGQRETIQAEYFAERGHHKDLDAWLPLLLDQPMAKDIALVPVLVVGSTSLLKSRILGADLNVKVANHFDSFGVAESLLAGMEALLATSRFGDVIPRKEVTNIEIGFSDSHSGMPLIRPAKNSRDPLEIIHSPNLDFKSAEEVTAYREWLTRAIIEVSAGTFLIPDFDAWAREVLSEEGALSRALILADTVKLNRNVFGNDPVFLLSDWVKPEDKPYALVDTANEWRASKRTADQKGEPVKPGSGSPPPGMFDLSKLKHTDHKLLSSIDVDLWNLAQWRAVAFGTIDPAMPSEKAIPPYMGFDFENEKAAIAIFEDWRARWGLRDEENALRISIIRGVSAKNPAHYSVTIGPNLDRVREVDAKTFVMISRIKRLEPTTTANLDRFLKEYERFGMYFLMPANGNPPKFMANLYFAKRELTVRDAWQIGENDPDLLALLDDDDPIVPPFITKAPVTEALKTVRAMRARRKRR